MKTFQQKVAVITGAGSGIGRELAIQLAQKGVHIAIADIQEEQLHETANLLVQYHVTVSTHVLDVSQREAVYRFADDVIARHKGVHIVINNAGVALSNVQVNQMAYEDFEWVLGVNLWGVVYGTKAFLPHLLKQSEANLVNTSSLYGLTAVAKAAAYCTSKFAVRGFTEALRQELCQTPVAVTVVHPGGIRTCIARNTRPATNGDIISNPEHAVQHFEQQAQTSAVDAARLIIEGIRRNTPRVIIGKDAKFLDLLGRLKPGSYDAFMLKHIVHEDEKAYAAAGKLETSQV
ncbi:short chain dehydrogenase, putative [Candidatus Vecturithrix granuli]|uniref:Short chain dehydrogenase, putative n=1 Tax=Vecturithrix granuli TaxID=1499967 RepID=A0A081C553_VECG1|nr:short chain dehydrogenase, putative [Candidatus Vecturithrix granuli]